MESIQFSLGGIGNISNIGNNAVQLRVRSKEELELLIKQFGKYPLITQKQVDYTLFKLAIDLIQKKEHLNLNGIQKLIEIKAVMNREFISDK